MDFFTCMYFIVFFPFYFFNFWGGDKVDNILRTGLIVLMMNGFR